MTRTARIAASPTAAYVKGAILGQTPLPRSSGPVRTTTARLLRPDRRLVCTASSADWATTLRALHFSGVAIAVAPSTYNQTEATNQVRVAYGATSGTNTWGNWCATCHPNMHSSGNYVHPIDQSLGTDCRRQLQRLCQVGRPDRDIGQFLHFAGSLCGEYG